jgi:hypothetical protein
MDPKIAGAGVLTYLFTIKEVRQVFGRFISGAGDVPLSYLERWAARIRSDTDAQKMITSAVASAARKSATKDSALVERARDRWTRQLAARQETREKIGIRALDVLAEGELPSGATAPSEDFMRAFEDMAEKASSAELVDLMARILAGEIRKPGSVSRRTLAVVPILDQEIVSALAEVRPFLLYGGWLYDGWIHTPPSAEAEWRRRFELLSSVSISSEVSTGVLAEQNGISIVRVGTKAIVIAVKPSIVGWALGAAYLTPIGRELISLLPLPTETKIEEIALGFREHNFVQKVSIGDYVEEGGTIKVTDAWEIVASPTAPASKLVS